jgi:VanZ family protein
MKYFFKRWAPSIIIMAVIFSFSSIPSGEMPRFGILDFTIKKMGHTIGYALLAFANSYGLQYVANNQQDERTTGNGTRHLRPTSDLTNLRLFVPAWLMTILYSASDEFHQSFVSGRNPSLWDVFIFDNIGAIFGCWIYAMTKSKRKV